MQKDFSAKGGKHYRNHPNVAFIKESLVPYCEKNGLKIAEIISDYRQPRLGDKDDSCNPGTIGYESEIPEKIKLHPIWVKCMNSPIWTRTGIGNPNSKPGLPYEDTKAFSEWIYNIIGVPEETDVVLIGLTIDCCVLCTAQELSMRGYNVFILNEGVDPYSGNQDEKQQILNSSILKNWTTIIDWKNLKKLIKLNEN